MTVREDEDLAREISDRMPAPTSLPPISVTNLVSPRSAYWRGIAAVPVAPERRDRLDLGRRWHRRLATVLAPDGAIEVRVRRDEWIGRLDALSDVPVEVKTSSSLPPVADLVRDRPEPVEQLAMYCALADRPRGRLVTVALRDEEVDAVQALDLEFADAPRVRGEMRTRADALRAAWRAGTPQGLPRCRWFDRGCEVRAAGICDCTGREGEIPATIGECVAGVAEREDLSSALRSRLERSGSVSTGPVLGGFRDLLYPRRAYFERTAGPIVPEGPFRPPIEPIDLYGRIAAATEAGPIGEAAGIPLASPEPEQDVGGFRGAPYLLRTSRAVDRPSPRTINDSHPQYALELGLRCVATGTSSARLFLGWERAPDDRTRLNVFEFRFAPVSAFSRFWRERRRALESALASGDPGGLVACPAWMFSSCPYRDACACGIADRSQR